jgi:hypothetical protein
MAAEMQGGAPLEGAINFYQAVERFEKYCNLCRSAGDDKSAKIICSGYARESLDMAYLEYLVNYQMILPMRKKVKPLPMMQEITTEDLRRTFEGQLNALQESEVKKYLASLSRIQDCCLSEKCEFGKISGEVGELCAMAKEVREQTESFYTEDLLQMVKKQLKSAAEDPDTFKSMFPLPPKPLKDEYRR